MTLLSARKRAEEFDALVNGNPSSRADLTELASVVTALREHTRVAPRPDFAATLREQLMVEAATVLTGEAKSLALPTRRRGARERRLVAAATAAVFIGGTTGMAAASQNALPGDALYPIKRTIERAEAGLNTDSAGKGRDLLGQAGQRLGEAQGLLAQGNTSGSQVPSTIEDFSAQASEGAQLLIKSFQEDRNPDDIASVREFAASSLAVLQELAKTAPPEAQEALAHAAMLLQDLDEQALSMCSVCATDLPPLQIKELLLTSIGVRDALERASKLDKDASATGEVDASGPTQPVKSTPSTNQQPSKSEEPGRTGGSGPGATVDKAKDGVKNTVEKSADPVENLVDQVLPGVGALLGDLTDSLSDGLVDGQ